MEKHTIPILMYHSISEPVSSGFRACTVSREAFDEHLSYLEDNHYKSVTVTQFVQAMGRGGAGLPSNPIILTFDDGYADFYTHALPALRRHGFTATLYVATGYVAGTSRWLRYPNERYRPMLSWTQLTEISASGIECGAHSQTHPQLNILPPSVARDEMVRSKELLEDHLGQEVSSFAYPFGYYNSHVRQIVQETGYASACAIKRALSSLYDDPYALARLAITADTQLNDLSTALSTGRGPLVASRVKRIRGGMRLYVQSLYGKLQYGRASLY